MKLLYVPEKAGAAPAIGGKAGNLLILEREGLPVPAWFCLTAEAFDSVYAGIRAEVSTVLDGVTWTEPASVLAAAGRIEELFRRAPLPGGLEAELARAFEGRFSSGTLVAVRSSAIAEDSDSSSFAGQLETHLHVPVAQVLARVRQCWASGFGARALAYMNHRKLDPRESRVAVVVQQMIDSRVSGVMFMAEPRTGDRSLAVVVAGFGLGEGIVSDRVETDTFTLHRDERRIVTRALSVKETRLVRNAGEGHGVVEMPVPLELREPAALGDAQLLSLLDLGLRVDRAYGRPQDIEWAIDASGAIHLTQARPITTLGKATFIFDNSNIVESYPGVTTPLTVSFIQRAYARIFGEALEAIGIPPARIAERQDALEHMLGYYEGRVYYNLTSWYRMFRVVPFIDPYIAVWEEMMGVEKRSDASARTGWGAFAAKLPLAAKIALSVVWRCVSLGGAMTALGQRFDDFHDRFWKESETPAANVSLWRSFTELSNGPLRGWGITLLNDGYAFIFSALSRALLRRMGLDPENAFNGLLCGEELMESVEPLQSILAMSTELRARGELLAGLRAARSEDELRGTLARAGGEFPRLFQRHLERFGDRGAGELKLETTTFREKPLELLKVVLTYVDSDVNPEGIRRRELEIRATARAGLRGKAFTHPLRYPLFRFALALAKRSVNYRESSRLDRTRIFGMVRRIFRAIGTNLVREGALDAVEDVHYLTLQELDDYIHGASPQPALRPLVVERRALERRYFEVTPPERLLFRGSPYEGARPEAAPAAAPETPTGSELRGIACAPGRVTGAAAIVLDPAKAGDVRGKILIAPMTDPGWVYLMVLASGLVVEKGSILSHTAIIGRELGIPTLVGVKGATRAIRDGQRVTIDGSAGRVILEEL